jgi:hypothetical protein
VGLLLLGDCANGDFGEVRPFLVADGIHDWVGSAAIAATKVSPSNFGLTDDERKLRDLAYPLIEPPCDRQMWYSIAGENGGIARGRSHAFDRTVYARRLLDDNYRSTSGRCSQLIDDIRNDITRLPQFLKPRHECSTSIGRENLVSLTFRTCRIPKARRRYAVLMSTRRSFPGLDQR